MSENPYIEYMNTIFNQDKEIKELKIHIDSLNYSIQYDKEAYNALDIYYGQKCTLISSLQSEIERLREERNAFALESEQRKEENNKMKEEKKDLQDTGLTLAFENGNLKLEIERLKSSEGVSNLLSYYERFVLNTTKKLESGSLPMEIHRYETVKLVVLKDFVGRLKAVVPDFGAVEEKKEECKCDRKLDKCDNYCGDFK